MEDLQLALWFELFYDSVSRLLPRYLLVLILISEIAPVLPCDIIFR